MKKIIRLTETDIYKLVEATVKKVKNNNALHNITFISYGTTEYDSTQIKPINIDKNSKELQIGLSRNKPLGGLWASPLNSDNSWGEWCSDNSFRLDTLSKHFIFKLNKNSNIYVIDDINDLIEISTITNIIGQKSINIPYLVQNYDGVFVTSKASHKLRQTPYDMNLNDLYSWDVESICIWNSNIIIPIEENAFEYANVPNYADKRDIDTYYDEDEASRFDMKRKNLQMDNDFLKYGNQNVHSDMSKNFNGEHPAILAQMHGNNKKAKLAKKFNGTIKSGM